MRGIVGSRPGRGELSRYPLAYRDGIRETPKTAVGSAVWRAIRGWKTPRGRNLNRSRSLLPDPRGPSSIAAVYAYRGESDEAFKWLDRAYEQKDSLLYGLKYRPEFDGLHDDPRYKAFLKKMNLPE